jgi:hypothetical protein
LNKRKKVAIRKHRVKAKKRKLKKEGKKPPQS